MSINQWSKIVFVIFHKLKFLWWYSSLVFVIINLLHYVSIPPSAVIHLSRCKLVRDFLKSLMTRDYFFTTPMTRDNLMNSRAETLKKKAISTTASPKPARSPVHTSGQRSIPPLGFSLQEEGGSTSQPQRSRGAAPPSGGGGGGGGAGNYSREEIEVLR